MKQMLKLPVIPFVAMLLAASTGREVVAQEQPEDAQPPVQMAPPTKAAPKAQRPAAPKQTPPAAPQVTQPSSAQLPNGASSINEVFGDWTVDCRISDGQKVCAFSQAQGNSQTGQRSFAIELRPPKDGKTDGTILMPFGLRLDAGAILKLDGQSLGQGLRFSTCVPQGCLLPVSFPTIATDAMKQAKQLTVASLNVSTGEAVTFNVSLSGFAAAFARVVALAG